MSFPKKVLMVTPTYFDVAYAINVHMRDEQGNLNKIDKTLASKQWNSLKSIYEELGIHVETIEGSPKLLDMVFCANTFLSLDSKRVVLSRMASKERAAEVVIMKEYFQKLSIETIEIPENLIFEGMGDCLWDYEGKRMFGGYGYRTSEDIYNFIRTHTDTPITCLQLIDERFYHLDTCLTIFNKTTAAYVPCAFTQDGIDTLKESFSNLIEITKDEAIDQFAANAHCPDGNHVIVHPGAQRFNKSVKKAGLQVIETDTSEYMKSGGSVFCMKHMLHF